MADRDTARKAEFRPPSEPFEQGLVQVYTGNGKGKTTAALGLTLRAVGQGLRVYIGQFLKGVPYGEVAALARLPNVTIKQFGRPEWVDPTCITAEDRAMAERALQAIAEAVHSGEYDVVILDEVNVAAGWGLLDVDEVVQLIKSRPASVELVLTGRSAPPEFVDLADLVTDMREIKHPYQKGITSRRGIEF
ncbi:MAG: cob(I)yrinic acid a,c-diamide adenosyltransferase [Chloroflexota bacterium]